MDEKKLELLREYAENPDSIQNASLDEKATYVDLVIEGCAHNIPDALEIMAYACYGGNGIFECDWNKSEECLLKLIEIYGDKRAYYHNSLGYIYYYGQGYNGIPDYDKAFKHFTIGAINGHMESVCKLSDMLINGLGVPKSPSAGMKLLLDVYPQCMEQICNEEYACNYADVAVRIGRAFEEDIFDEGVDIFLAFAFFMRAKYAIELRRQHCNEQFDDQIEAKIIEDYEHVRKYIPEDYFKDEVILDTPEPLGLLVEGSAGVDVELYKEDDEWYIHGTRLVAENMTKHVFLCYPEVECCRLFDEFTVRLVGANEEILSEYDKLPAKAFINEISGNGEGRWEFKYNDKLMVVVECEGFGVGRE